MRAIVRAYPSLIDGAAEPEIVSKGGLAHAVSGASFVALAGDPAHRTIGPALVLAERRGCATAHLLVDGPVAAGSVARYAAALAGTPAVAVWQVDGTEITSARPVAASPPDLPHPDLLALDADIVAAGAEPVVEHGVLTGEVVGLEVLRAVWGDDGRPTLDVGVSRSDREAFRELHGATPDPEAIAGVVAHIASKRHPGAPHHPLATMARERWLRWLVCRRPDLVGAASLKPSPSPWRKLEPTDTAPCVAAGDGLVVVCSSGIDLDLVPVAIDAAPADGRVVLFVRDCDRSPFTTGLAERMRVPTTVVTAPTDWATLA